VLGGVRVRLGRRRRGPVRSVAVASGLGSATVGCRFGAAMVQIFWFLRHPLIMIWGFSFFLEGKMGSCERDPVDQQYFIFWFLAYVSIGYWWAKNTCILP
jgi:hypothetical protein